MKKFQIFRYLKKILPLIIVICLLATGAVYYKLSASNNYIASEVIHYNDEQAEKGLAPDGGKLDVNEIKSSAVMSKVVDKLGLTGIYSVDSLISRISIKIRWHKKMPCLKLGKNTYINRAHLLFLLLQQAMKGKNLQEQYLMKHWMCISNNLARSM